jgi:haloalkane dehalogenase
MDTAILHPPTTALAPAFPGWLDRTLYPFTPRRFETPEGAISYLDEGRGPPVLFVHGTPSWSFEWREVIRALSGDFRCIAPDHLGFGLSDKPQASLDPADHARRLRALVTHLGLEDATLVVHDFGGPIGLPLALDDDGTIGRVVLLNTWMWSNADDPRVAKIDRVVRSPLGRFLYRWLSFSPRVLLPAAMGRRAKLSRAAHRHYLRPFSHRIDREGPYAMARALAGSSAYYASLWERRGALAGLPLSIVWGMRDPAFDPAALDRFTTAFPQAKVTRLEEVGHFPAEEHPEAVAAAIREVARHRP